MRLCRNITFFVAEVPALYCKDEKTSNFVDREVSMLYAKVVSDAVDDLNAQGVCMGEHLRSVERFLRKECQEEGAGASAGPRP